MTELKFKTNINCGSCIKSVKPFLDEAVGENNWSVDTDDEKNLNHSQRRSRIGRSCGGRYRRWI